MNKKEKPLPTPAMLDKMRLDDLEELHQRLIRFPIESSKKGRMLILVGKLQVASPRRANNLVGFVESLNKAKEALSKKGATTIGVQESCHNGLLEVVGSRLETAEEVQARLNQIKDRKDYIKKLYTRIKQQERALFLHDLVEDLQSLTKAEWAEVRRLFDAQIEGLKMVKP